VGWYAANSGGRPHPVAERDDPRHPCGLYDMHGNVWEWCGDWFDSRLAGGLDPRGPRSGRWRVQRGGSYGLGAWGCRSACRGREVPGWAKVFYGFRLCLAAPEPEDGGSRMADVG